MASTLTDLDTSSRRDTRGVWTRRAVIAVFCLIAVLALADVFGQKTSHSKASGPAAEMELAAPEVVRGGLFFQSQLEIRARRKIEYPRIVLDEGWLEGMQVNSIEPAPATEANRQGRVVLTYDALEAGDLLRIWFQFEVDPTTVGRRP